MTEPATPVNVNKDVIDGSKVLHRETAKLFTPASKHPDQLSPTYGVDRCVLEDARVVFQCVHPDPPECEYWHERGESVRSHLRKHTITVEKERQKAVIQELAALQAREAARKQNYREGALRGAAKRRENANGNGGKTNDTNGNDNEGGASMTAKDMQKKIDIVQTSLEGVVEDLEKVVTVISNMQKTLGNGVASLEDISATDLVDPALVDKAAQWDALQGLLGRDRPTR